MPLVNHARSELHLKLVYYGPGLGGKTTNLEFIHRKSRPELRGKLISFMTASERTLFFDLLPLDLGAFRGYGTRLHLCTVPGQASRDDVRRLVLRNVDGIVFVADSQREQLQANAASMRTLPPNLEATGQDFAAIPLVLQYNKRDLPGAMDIALLRRELALPRPVQEFEASAVMGWGVFDTLKAIAKECLAHAVDPKKASIARKSAPLRALRSTLERSF